MSQSSDENVWALIAWAATIVGAISALILKPNSKYVKHWSYLSISFFVIFIIGYAAIYIISLIIRLLPIIGPILSSIIYILYLLIVFIIWVVGIIRSISGIFWKPRFIYDLAIRLGIEKI